MVVRIWHGYTSKQNADAYEKLLTEEIFVEIERKQIPGFIRIELLRRETSSEVEFTTIMWFDNIESVMQFAGDDYEEAYVPDKARNILSRFDKKAVHYDLRHQLHNSVHKTSSI